MLSTRAELLADGVTRGILCPAQVRAVVYGTHLPAGIEQTLWLNRADALAQMRGTATRRPRWGVQPPDRRTDSRPAVARSARPHRDDCVAAKNPPRHKGVK